MGKPITLKFYSDPGHGWLAVKMSLLERVGFDVNDFTAYSYRKGDTVYLEEDCDASRFMESLQRVLDPHEYTIVEKSTNKRSTIRSYPSIHT